MPLYIQKMKTKNNKVYNVVGSSKADVRKECNGFIKRKGDRRSGTLRRKLRPVICRMGLLG